MKSITLKVSNHALGHLQKAAKREGKTLADVAREAIDARVDTEEILWTFYAAEGWEEYHLPPSGLS
jgi:hypothetical protein